MGEPASAGATKMLALARQVERLSSTDPDSAAAKLGQLAAAVREMREHHDASSDVTSAPLPVWADQLDRALADLADRTRTGHIKAVGGLERRVRQFLLALELTADPTRVGAPPSART